MRIDRRFRFIVAGLFSLIAAAGLHALPAVQKQAQTRVPAPDSVIGWGMCADHKLADYEQVAAYFRVLDEASPRMQLVEIGKTAEGRPQIMAMISSEANLGTLARYKEIARSLALVRDAKGAPLAEDAARALAREGKAVVWVDMGIHSTEVAPPQLAPWAAHRLVSDESEEVRAIRDQVIVLLVPSMNPDGQTLVANWYRKHVGTPLSKAELPELYQKYVGHDNNRDWFMFNQVETRNVGRQLYHEWFPQIVYNQHQTGAFPARITIPPYEDPPNPHIPPLVLRGVTEVGAAMARRFDREGKTGAIARIQYDTWWNGGMRSAPYFHNMIGILTETQHNTADPVTYDPARFPKTFADGTSTSEPSTFYPSPFRGGEWHLRNSCEYNMSATLAVLDLAAKRREEWLIDIWQMGRDAIRAGEKETYVVPAEQWDSGAAWRLVNALRWGGIEVERATAPFTADGRTYDAGSFIIRGAQPFRPHLTDLLNPQVYPDRRIYPGGPPERPYDITGWTLSYQMGVDVRKLAQTVAARTEPVTFATATPGDVTAVAKYAYALDPRTNDSVIAVNRLLKAGDQVQRTTAPIVVPGRGEWPAGTWLVLAATSTHTRVEAVARELGLRVGTLDAAPSGAVLRLRQPRVALYRPAGGNMDEGWTRWIFEQYEIPFVTIRDADVRAGDLRARFDVVVLPDATYDAMRNGFAEGTMPPEHTGGMTPAGVANLYEFTTAGGTLVAMDHASELPLAAFGLPVRNNTSGLDDTDFYMPGTLVRVTLDPAHPVAYGLPADVTGFFDESQAFVPGRSRSRWETWLDQQPPPPDDVTIVGRYAPKELLRSGWMLGGDRFVAGRPAILDAKVGQGRVILLGFRVQHRGQTHGTFKLLFNALYLGAAERA